MIAATPRAAVRAEASEGVPAPPAWTPVLVRVDHCKGCALCVTACVKGSLAIDEHVVNVLGYHPVRLAAPETCTSCALCARVCPDCVLTILAAPRRTAR
jgi:2-oxoglutarate ferredoxin oxidoreductase subunit delta